MIDLSHKKLKVWEKSKALVSEVYKLTNELPKSETYGLTSQMRRASISIISNLSEGASRKSNIEKKGFFEILRLSLVGLDSQIEISINLELLFNKEIEFLKILANEIFAMLSNLIKRYEI